MANENTGIVPEDRGGSTVSPQPSRDPADKPDRTDGGNTPSGIPPAAPAAVASVRTPTTGTSGFVGYPQTKYHPMLGARTVNDPNEAHGLPGPAHNWFDTPGEADMHRTDLEAQEVIHNARRVKLEGHVATVRGEEPPPPPTEDNPNVVRLSVQAEENLGRGAVEPH